VGHDYLLRVLDPGGFFYTNVFDHWSGDVNQRTICAFVGNMATKPATGNRPCARAAE